MEQRPRIGLLPLYLKLYDDTLAECRGPLDAFVACVHLEFMRRGVEASVANVCRVASEVEQAVAAFESERVDCLVTLHLAYSPSLESAPALCRTRLPLLMLDTTMDAAFGRDTDPARIMYNHGVHGVMDLASVLRRHERPFRIVAGHIARPAVMQRAVDAVLAAGAARRFRGMRALRIGDPFHGMGDFQVEEKVLREKLGLHVDARSVADLERAMGGVTGADVEREMHLDRQRYTVEAPAPVHQRSVLAGLGLRRMLEEGRYQAFSVNFQAFDRADAPPVPFAEISKSMARGIGYGGEGDVLTAALVGALTTAFEEVSFTEIFCADWSGESLFLSHMGEVNPEVAAARPLLIEKPMPFLHAPSPAVIVCGVRPGPAVFVNLAPGPHDGFELLVAPVEVLGDTSREDMRRVVRAWVRPQCPVAEFLETYSRHGGTHHSALVLGDRTEALCAFAEFAGIGWRAIGGRGAG